MTLAEVASKGVMEAMKLFDAARGRDLISRQQVVADAEATIRVAEVCALASIAASLEVICAKYEDSR